MPKYEIGLEDGRRLHIEADDVQSALAGAQHFLTNEQQPQQQQQSAPVTAGGLAKSAATGTVQGLAGIAGLPGDAEKLATKGLHWLTGTPGPSNPNDTYLPNSAELERLAQDNLPLHEPLNTAEKYAASVGSMVPAAVGGPEGIAGRLLTRAVVPGVAAEAAGEATAGTPYEPVARAAGAVLTPALASGAGAIKAAAKVGSKVTPEIAQAAADNLMRRGGDALDALRDQDVKINRAPIASQAVNKLAEFERRGWNEDTAPVATKALKGLDKSPERIYTGTTSRLADAPPPVTIQELQTAKASLRSGMKSVANPEDRAASSDALDTIDGMLENLQQYHMLSGSAADVRALASQGRQLYGQGKALERINGVQAKAKASAEATGSGLNTGNMLRQGYKSFAFSKQNRGYTPAEAAQLARIYQGTSGGNLARYASNILGGGGGIGSLGVDYMVHGLFGGPGLAVPAAGLLFRGLSNASTMRRVAQLQQLIMERGSSIPATAQNGRSAPIMNAAIRALLAMQGSRSQ